MIRRIDPDEAVTINGVPVTGRQLAEARQELSHRGVHNPRWAELSQHDQETAALSAGSWLRALADLVPDISEASDDDWVPPTYTRSQIASVLDRLPEAPSDAAPYSSGDES